MQIMAIPGDYGGASLMITLYEHPDEREATITYLCKNL